MLWALPPLGTAAPSSIFELNLTVRRRLPTRCACVLAFLSMTACQTVQNAACDLPGVFSGCEAPASTTYAQEAVPTSATVQDPTEVKYYPSDEPLRLGKEHFGRGNYGLAERYFRDAVEKAPRDVTAWLGLAASYDRLRRFELADQAYAEAIRLRGATMQILNNQGYSYMLRGDLARAREKFLQAYKLDPKNSTIQNNLHLLNSSHRFIQRTPDQL
jgi:Flp pilus assembly protein TadD